jgi:predicted RNase H-like HicB family nuclease
MKVSYPAVFYPWEEGEGYTVEFPDLPGCITEGRSITEAIFYAVDAASGWLLMTLEGGERIPRTSAIQDVKLEEGGGIVSLIAVDIDAYAEKHGSKAVRKNVTIPAWLNTFAEQKGVNFSKLLQSGLILLYEQYLEETDEYEYNDKTAELFCKFADPTRKASAG